MRVPFSDQQRSAVALYRKGTSYIDIEKQTGINANQLKNLRRREGGLTRPRVGQKGRKASRWIGGRYETKEGYVYLYVAPDDPLHKLMARRNRCFEHRIVMARHLKRPLKNTETVHHKNGIKNDNSFENLQLRKKAHGPGHVACCADCGSVNIEYKEA